MVVMTPREKWTDERLDDLQTEMREGFARLDRRIDRVDEDIKNLQREMNARFDAVNRNMMSGFFVVVAAIIGSNVF